ncbi:hypothetical protein J6590_005374 [Homalodisca vitripennis]|nr:hypothetical protein J6590_005374 [Homalodisca vitripennis]
MEIELRHSWSCRSSAAAAAAAVAQTVLAGLADILYSVWHIRQKNNRQVNHFHQMDDRSKSGLNMDIKIYSQIVKRIGTRGVVN